MELPKTYNPKEIEDDIYTKWEESGFFNPDNLPMADSRYEKGEPFCIMMPPPNATGQLHVGHAMGLTLQDLMIRRARMQGKKTLWLPGTDHAAIATNYVVERELWEKEKKTRQELGREEFLARVEEFVKKTQGTIQKQIRKIGSSCDWTREKYTLSDELSRAVRVAFVSMYDAGLIYRGERIINWCPRCGTTLADDEVEHKETKGTLYYIKYPIVDSDGEYLTIATTRPETMLADTAVAVNPKDKRYKKYIGQKVMLPLINRELPVIDDEHVDQKFGTGVLKVTPGHDPHDFEIGQRHGLDSINLFTKEGVVDNTEALDHHFDQYAGLSIKDVRVQVINDLTDAGFLEKTEHITHNVSYCYRCDSVIEPMISKQWFVDVHKKFKIKNAEFQKKLQIKDQTSLKEMATAAVISENISIVPDRFVKIYQNWMENLRDWNISRQIWFGHRIPIWYCNECDETIAAVETPTQCTQCKNESLIQDPDTLDTWFSSSLWTFSTLGWPNETQDLITYHPTDTLETGHDILFFWIARMVIMTGFLIEDIPFKSVYLHGLVRDKQGKKMSKSLGNGIDPLEMIDTYGADALRLSLIIGTTPGNDVRLYPEKIASYRNFANKLWNIARFIIQNVEKPQIFSEAPSAKTLADKWILEQLEDTIVAANRHLDAKQFSLAGETMTQFTWGEFADWYIEIAKLQLKDEKLKNTTEEILLYVLATLLKLWHPFIPFVTEHIWSKLSDTLIIIDTYPESHHARDNADAQSTTQFIKLKELITGLRNLRSEYNVPADKEYATYIPIEHAPDWIKEQEPVITRLARVHINYDPVDTKKKMPNFIWEGSRVWLIIPEFDAETERTRTEKDLKKITQQLGKIEAQLAKKTFIKKAPKEVVEKMKAHKEEFELKKEKLKQKISQLT